MLPLIIGLEGISLNPLEVMMIQRHQPVGFILFSRNIESSQQVNELTAHLRSLSQHIPIIAIDQEGGRVIRTAALGLQQPSAGDLSRLDHPDYIIEHAQITALALRYLGINLNFAPVLDLDNSGAHANALSSRCWGNNVEQVLQNAGLYNHFLQKGGILSCGKHFPGLGLAKQDPHFFLPVIQSTLNDFLKRDLIPFTAMMPWLPSLMIAHFLMPDIDEEMPSSLSSKMVTQLLRNQLGYEGVVFTDDLCMQAILEKHPLPVAVSFALESGCDLPLVCHDVTSHLPNIAIAIECMNTPQQYDRNKRIDKLLKQLSPPLPFDHKAWDSILQRAQSLSERICPMALHDTPSSPVQTY